MYIVHIGTTWNHQENHTSQSPDVLPWNTHYWLGAIPAKLFLNTSSAQPAATLRKVVRVKTVQIHLQCNHSLMSSQLYIQGFLPSQPSAASQNGGRLLRKITSSNWPAATVSLARKLLVGSWLLLVILWFLFQIPESSKCIMYGSFYRFRISAEFSDFALKNGFRRNSIIETNFGRIDCWMLAPVKSKKMSADFGGIACNFGGITRISIGYKYAQPMKTPFRQNWKLSAIFSVFGRNFRIRRFLCWNVISCNFGRSSEKGFPMYICIYCQSK